MKSDRQDHDHKKDRPPSYMMFSAVSCYLLMLIAFISALFFFAFSLKNLLYKEQTLHLNEITEKMVQSIDTVFSTQWEHTVYLSNRLGGMPIETTGDLAQSLNQMEKDLALKSASVFAFDEYQNYYSLSGFQGRWPLEDSIPSNPHKHQMLVTNIDGLCDDQEQMVFIRKLPQPIYLNESQTTVTHLALVRGMSSLNESFLISNFGKTSSTYIIHPDGRRVYRNAFWEAPTSVDNILTELLHVKFLHGTSVDLLKKDLYAKKSGSMQIRYEGKDSFLSYAPMRNNDWCFILFVPADVVCTNSQRFMNSMMTNISMVTCVVILLVCLNIYLLFSTYNSKRLMIQQTTTNLALQQAAVDARKASQAKSDFLSHISHDVRTPIHGIIGMTMIAQKNIQDPERVEDCLKKISAASDHLLMLVNDVLDMSKIEKGKVQIDHTPFDMEKLLNHCICIISGELAQRHVTFEQDYARLKHRRLIGDALHLNQILINILGNSIKFTPNNGRITLRVQETAYDSQTAWFRFDIEDTGIGMSEEFLRHLFEPFMQEESAAYCNPSGTGLGMSIVKGLLDAMGGNIKVKSRLGQGSLFTIRLGFLMDHSSADIVPAQNAPQNLSQMRVLLVEDHPINREIAEYTLTEHGILVAHAGNGQEALTLFAQSQSGEFDIILMDITMPVMNGLDACRAIRQLEHPDAAHIPIIAMSANAYVEDIQKALESGMDDYLAKPIDLDQLFAVLNRYNRSKHTQQTE